MLQIAVPRPMISPGRPCSARCVAVLLLACLLVTAGWWRGRRSARYHPHRTGARPTGAVRERSWLFPVDRLAMGCYLGIFTWFALSVSAGFHGSALSRYSTFTTVTGAPLDPIVGRAKPIRSDEWAYHTPAMLHQVYRRHPSRVR